MKLGLSHRAAAAIDDSQMNDISLESLVYDTVTLMSETHTVFVDLENLLRASDEIDECVADLTSAQTFLGKSKMTQASLEFFDANGELSSIVGKKLSITDRNADEITQVCLESMKDTLKATKDTLIRWWDAFVKAVKSLVQKIMDMLPLQRNILKKLVARVKETSKAKIAADKKVTILSKSQFGELKKCISGLEDLLLSSDNKETVMGKLKTLQDEIQKISPEEGTLAERGLDSSAAVVEILNIADGLLNTFIKDSKALVAEIQKLYKEAVAKAKAEKADKPSKDAATTAASVFKVIKGSVDKYVSSAIKVGRMYAAPVEEKKAEEPKKD